MITKLFLELTVEIKDLKNIRHFKQVNWIKQIDDYEFHINVDVEYKHRNEEKFILAENNETYSFYMSAGIYGKCDYVKQVDEEGFTLIENVGLCTNRYIDSVFRKFKVDRMDSVIEIEISRG
jgi:hypothetical protein